LGFSDERAKEHSKGKGSIVEPTQNDGESAAAKSNAASAALGASKRSLSSGKGLHGFGAHQN
jgi:hypothetical protein